MIPSPNSTVLQNAGLLGIVSGNAALPPGPTGPKKLTVGGATHCVRSPTVSWARPTLYIRRPSVPGGALAIVGVIVWPITALPSADSVGRPRPPPNAVP